MKLYLLIRKGNIGHDEYDSMVVRAFNAAAARKLANQHCGDEGKIWTDGDKVICRNLLTKGQEKIMLQSFNAG